MPGHDETNDTLLTVVKTRASVRKFFYSPREATVPVHSASRAATIEEEK